MHDTKLEERKLNFLKGNISIILVDVNILERHENHKLSLRKQKVEDYIMSKRLTEWKNRQQNAKNPNEIIIEDLILSDEYKNINFNDMVISNII